VCRLPHKECNTATNPALDPSLLYRVVVVVVSAGSTKKAAVTLALQVFIARREQRRVSELLAGCRSRGGRDPGVRSSGGYGPAWSSEALRPVQDTPCPAIAPQQSAPSDHLGRRRDGRLPANPEKPEGQHGSVHEIGERPLHQGPGAFAGVDPSFNGSSDWYERYEARQARPTPRRRIA
jgi:hypothetical protein